MSCKLDLCNEAKPTTPNSVDLYERYTTTSMLPPGMDVNAQVQWGSIYFRANFARHLPVDRKAAILEVGCGYGQYLKALSVMGYENCYGVDLSGEQIVYAKSKLGLANVEQADALVWLEGKENVYDCILALDFFEHLDNDTLLRLGKKILRALKPNGTIIIQVPNDISPISSIPQGDLTHVRAFTQKSIQQFFLHVGLVPIGFFDVPPHAHGLKSVLRRILWFGFLKPLIDVFCLIIHGKKGGIYTANLIAIASKGP